MAKKTAKHSKSKSNAGETDKSKSSSSTSPETTTAPAQSQSPAATNGSTAARPPPAPSAGASIPLKFRLLFLLFPLLQMLWQIEAPMRPFSALRDPTTGEILRRPRMVEGVNKIDGELVVIEPKILVVLPHVRDLGLFAPTVGIMLGKQRKEKSTLFVVGLSSGSGSSGEWENALDVFGLEKERRFLLDVPELQDKPNAIWDPNVVADSVLQYILEHNIDTILTFDEQGITGNPQHTAVSQGITSLVRSPRLKDALNASESSPDSERIHPRVFLLRTPLPFLNLGPLSPIIQHFILAYRTLRSSETKLMRTTTFVSDVRLYYKSWKALGQIGGEMDPMRLAWWVVGRSLWVNEWVEA